MSKQPILVTNREFLKAEQLFRSVQDLQCDPAPPEEDALAEMVAQRGVRAVIVGITPYRGPLYEALASVAAGFLLTSYNTLELRRMVREAVAALAAKEEPAGEGPRVL